jgi:hypothetical protein
MLKPIKPNKRYIRQLKSPDFAVKRHVDRNTANSPKEIGTGLKGSITAMGPRIQVIAVDRPTWASPVTVDL